MKDKDIYVIGVGHNTIVTIDLAEACGYRVLGLYHYNNDRTGELYFGHKIIGSTETLFCKDLTGCNFAISVGDNHIRADIYNKLKSSCANLPTLIHPSAVVSKYAEIGDGCCVHSGACVSASATICDDCVVSLNTIIIHGAVMKNHSFIAPASLLGGNTIMDEYSFLGLNATTISNKVPRIGKNAIVGAGSVVTRSVEDNQIVAGNPAHPINHKK